jgi:hypothetical protein
MASWPPIPQRYSSLVPESSLKDMEILSKRTVSAMTAISQLSMTSSTDDFIDAKIESISAHLAVNSKFRDFFGIAKKSKIFTDEEYDDAVKELQSEVDQKERELITLKRQKKVISDDIDEVLPQYSTIEGAYSSVLRAKIMSATGKQKKGKSFDQSAFSKAVLSYYGAVRRLDAESTEKYCHLLGWLPEDDVKCAHLVPKSLESEELAYLFGVREAVLSEPRNGMFASSWLLLSMFLNLGLKELRFIESLKAAWIMVGLRSFLRSRRRAKKQFGDACWWTIQKLPI